ncbi:MAG: hypothetical protein Q3959_04235 [Limosilactobacillus sp.]|uniref:hypothetical protein n=1 Tax=Limosilactobacillus sp. TaxID=2773925 RepID=UPI0026FF4857|nr:hypothetical protein [Limosilactobacillus sp.]
MEKMNHADVRAQLTIARQQGTLIEVHNIPDDSYFNVGFVLAMDPQFCLMISIDWDGKINGLIVIRTSSINYIAKGTDYLMSISEKTKVAHEYGYFDIFKVQDFVDAHPEFVKGDLLNNVLNDSYENKLPVVVGTDQYKGSDDFQGMIVDRDRIKISLHYFNEKDLSSLWEYDILLAKIDYVRVRGTQAATAQQILNDLFRTE